MSLLPIISREEARQKGLKRFFTGKPCKHGHVCERRVDSSECAECGRTRGRAYHRRPDVKERVQAHRQQREGADPGAGPGLGTAAGGEGTETGLPPAAGGEEAIAGMGAETPRYETSEQRQERVTQEVKATSLRS